MLKKAAVKNGKILPCLKSTDGSCPCDNHSGEIARQDEVITEMRCEWRKMHKLPQKGEGS